VHWQSLRLRPCCASIDCSASRSRLSGERGVEQRHGMTNSGWSAVPERLGTVQRRPFHENGLRDASQVLERLFNRLTGLPRFEPIAT